jgi:hypothetical protein
MKIKRPSFANADRMLAAINGTVVFGVLMLLTAKAFYEFRAQDHDFMSYHLPNALKRLHLSSYIPPDVILRRGAGLPRLPQWLQGMLVLATGKISAAGALNMLGFITFALITFLMLPRRNWFSVLLWTNLMLAVPMIVFNLNSGYIDLWSCTGVTIAFLAASGFIDNGRWQNLVVAAVGLGWACLSKVQLWPVSMLLSVTLAILAVHKRNVKVYSRWRLTLGIGLIFLAVSFWPVKNFLQFRNPFFPFEAPIVGKVLARVPGYKFTETTHEGTNAFTPHHLRGLAKPVQFAASMFESSRFIAPGYRWSQSQFVSEDSPHQLIGGWSILTMCFVIFLAGLLLKASKTALHQFTVLLAPILILTSFMPQSYELRYWMYVPMCLITFVVLHSELLDRKYRTHILMLSAALAFFTISKTVKFQNLWPRPSQPSDFAPAEAKHFWSICGEIKSVSTICADDPFAIYWAGPTFKECVVKGRVLAESEVAHCDIDARTTTAADWNKWHPPAAISDPTGIW